MTKNGVIIFSMVVYLNEIERGGVAIFKESVKIKTWFGGREREINNLGLTCRWWKDC